MHQRLARYHARSPRYILNTEDDCLIRVAGPRQIPWEEGTEIRNVSLTGLAFTAPEDLTPLIGEVIRIQFQVPGGEQTACHAIVTRLEQDRVQNGMMLVAVHFYKLEMAHRILLAQGLSKRFRDQIAKKGREGLEESAIQLKMGPLFMMASSISLWFLMTLIFLTWNEPGFLSFLRLLGL